MRQASFGFTKNYPKEFGGSLLLGKRKEARPLSTKHPIFMTLKSTHTSFFNPSTRSLERVIREYAAKYQIKIHEFSLNWTHIHFAISIPSKENYLAFIRTLTAEIVRLLSKALGKNLKGLFDLRPHSRIVTWGRELKSVIDYIILNQMEAWGLIRRDKKSVKPRGKRKIPKSPFG